MTTLVPDELLDLLGRLAHGIVSVVGPHCEIVVHDFSDLEHSAVIVEGHVTGRKPGAPIPDLSFLPEEIKDGADDQINYRSTKGNHSLQSSTIFLNNPTGKVIGAVCINMDYSELLDVRDHLNKLIDPVFTKSSDYVVTETFARDLQELLVLSVQKYLTENNISDVDSLNQNKKLELIDAVEKRGLFQIRGAVQQLADLLHVSRASIYNYRATLRDHQN